MKDRRGTTLGTVAAITLVLASACGSGSAGMDPAEIAVIRDRAAEYFARGNEWEGTTRDALAPLVAREDAADEDLIRAALVEIKDEKPEAARALLARVDDLRNDPYYLWCRFRLHRIEFENEEALAQLEAIRAQHPDDVPTHLAIAIVQRDIEASKDLEPSASVAEYESLLAVEPEYLGAWRVTALYGYWRALAQSGVEKPVWEPFFEEYKRLDAAGVESPGEPEHQAGTFGAVTPQSIQPFGVETPVPTITATGADVDLDACPIEELRGAFALRPDRSSSWNDVSLAFGAKDDELKSPGLVPHALVVFGEDGLALKRTVAGSGEWQHLFTEPVLDCVPYDRANYGSQPVSEVDRTVGDRNMDLLVVTGPSDAARLLLLENKNGDWLPPLEIHTYASAPRNLVPVDFDHDGDADLALGTAAGPRLLRNDGFEYDAERAQRKTQEDRTRKPGDPATLPGKFVDATADSGLPGGDCRVGIEDVDGDQDVDLLLFDADGGLRLMSSRRAGRFERADAPTPAGRVVLADLDGSGWTDFVGIGDGLALHSQGVAGAFATPRTLAVAARPTGPPVAVDWDLDGTTDLMWPAEGVGVAGVLAPGFAKGGVAFDLASAFEGADTSGPATLQVLDADGDHDLDVLFVNAKGVRLVKTAGGRRGTSFDLMGYKDNSLGIGTVVEIRTGLEYRRVFWRGVDQLLAMGDEKSFDVVRMTWPNGVIQSFFELPLEKDFLGWQRPGQAGSCPFLYTWNGTEFEFISDVLGITPLGLPMAPGMLVPPDHDEYVLVRGEQLVPKDGKLVMHFTEELREVTYLDHVRLDVVDHPEGTEVFPNERFSFPPFPEAHTHLVKDPLVPLSAVDQDGTDWAAALAADDGEFAEPFDVYRGQYQGLATPYTLELAFDAEAFANAPKLRLLMNGWLFWTDASVNVAAARHPAHEFVPPLLFVPDGNGGWEPRGALGFPAGKLKTMVCDVTDLVKRDDPRVRIHSTLRLYWDSIRLAVDGDDAERRTTSLMPVTADLWERGFSRPVVKHGSRYLEWFDWNELEPEPRWNQHPGMYTRFGDTLPLLSDIDDVFVVMGAGDALTLAFDAGELPPLPEGWRRDYLVFLDGWAKDRDPNTAEALYVDPLPFHGMSAYPYGEDEAFPDTEAHRAWLREYQTRPARRNIEPLAPLRPVPRRGSPEAMEASFRR